jgi:FixJ family two-component response regulator
LRKPIEGDALIDAIEEAVRARRQASTVRSKLAP